MNSVMCATTFIEDCTATLMAHVRLRPTSPTTDGATAATSDISALKARVYDISDVTTPTSTFGQTTLTTSDVFFGTTLAGWDVDVTGHNFRYVVAATAFPTGNTNYRAEVEVTFVDGAVGKLLWEGMARSVTTSST
jgi:hypothetical protein